MSVSIKYLGVAEEADYLCNNAAWAALAPWFGAMDPGSAPNAVLLYEQAVCDDLDGLAAELRAARPPAEKVSSENVLRLIDAVESAGEDVKGIAIVL